MSASQETPSKTGPALLVPKTAFKTSNGQYLTKALFFEETMLADRHLAVYTLKDQDHTAAGVVYPSLYRLYMEVNDPTEYRFAVTHLGGWTHWEMLREASWFAPYASKWQRELDLRLKSESLSRIILEARARSKESFNANKYLLEKGWDSSSGNKRGRPSKDQIRAEAREILSNNRSLAEDASRLGLN